MKKAISKSGMSHILDFSFVAFRSLVSALSQLTGYKSNVTESTSHHCKKPDRQNIHTLQILDLNPLDPDLSKVRIC